MTVKDGLFFTLFIIIIITLVFYFYSVVKEPHYEFKEQELKYKIFLYNYEEELNLWQEGIFNDKSKIRESSYFSTDEIIKAFKEMKDIGLLERYNDKQEELKAYRNRYGIFIFIIIISFIVAFIITREERL